MVSRATLAGVIGCVLCMLSWIFAALLIHNGYRFYRLRNAFVFIKRRGNIVVAYNLCGIIILLLGYPLMLLVSWEWNLFTNHKSGIYIFLTIINDLCYNPFYYFVAFLTLLRVWMIYYDINLSNSCLNLKWKQIIHHDLDTLKKEKWYIQHGKTLGNEPFMLKLTIFCGSIVSIISMTSVYLYEFGVTTLQLWLFVNALVFWPYIIMLIIIWRKMPAFNDNIYLYKEFKVISYSCFLTFFGYSVAVALGFVFGNTLIINFFAEISGMIAIFMVPFVSTYWVLKQTELFSNHTDNEHIMDEFSLSTPSENSQPQRSISLQRILQDNELINLFMQHLIKEFSMECLLALIEFQQYKAYLIEKMVLNKTDDIAIDFVFPEEVPLSDIVYMDSCSRLEKQSPNNDENADDSLMLQFKIKAYKLYKKYIEIGSEFEINISYRHRCTLDYCMSNKDKWISHDNQNINKMDLVKIFDQPTKEMVQLLNYSKARFKYQTI